jgi:hypothetical protein
MFICCCWLSAAAQQAVFESDIYNTTRCTLIVPLISA